MDEIREHTIDSGLKRKNVEGTQIVSLRDLHDKHVGKITDKWHLYIEELDRVLSVLRDQKIVILEIGVQNGGSLEIWSEYFPKAQKIVGIDIDPKCGELRFADPRISIIVGDAASEDGKRKVLQQVSTFDLVIDDGSHKSSDIVRAFGCFFPLLNESGFYIVEDLHCSYMADHEGGLHNPLSAMAFFRRLTDITNYEHWRNNRSREYLLREFSAKYEVNFDNLDLARIHSVGFINSLCVIEKAVPGRNVLGKRIVAGTEEFVTSGAKKVNQTLIHDVLVNIEDDTRLDVFEVINANHRLQEKLTEKEQAVQHLQVKIVKREGQIAALDTSVKEQAGCIGRLEEIVREKDIQIISLSQTVAKREGQIAAFLSSRSWQITAPLRAIGFKLRMMRSCVAIAKAICGVTRTNGLRNGYRLFKGRRLLLISGTFDANYYLRQNPDVAAARIDPALHFMMHGVREGRNPNAFFDTSWYLRNNLDVAEAGLNPLVHYIQFGADEGRDTGPRFSGSAYFATNPDVAAAGMDPLEKRAQTIFSESQEEISYTEWIAENEPSEEDLERQKNFAETFSYLPLISIITPVYNTPLKILKEMIESVLIQTYNKWELCLADGSPENPEVQSILEEYANNDRRIRVKFLSENLGISGNSNEALSLAKGEFIALLDHDDLLAPFALFEVVKRLNEDPQVDFIYSDKDLVTEDGKRRFQPLFKPDWSPEIMLSANYLTHLCVIRKCLVDEIGGFLSETDGAQDWDLFLRITERTERIAHIPKVAYHWRESPTSVARGIDAKPYASAAQQNALQCHLQRRGLTAKVSFELPGLIRVRWLVTGSTKISIIIPAKDNIQILRRCIESILYKTSYENFEVVVVDSGSSEPAVVKYYEYLSKDSRFQIINYDAPFNYSAVNNLGVRYANGDAFLFLNNNTEILNSDWLEEMVGWIEQKEIGVVGAKLLNPDGTIQHAGLVIGLQGFVGHIFAGAPEGYWGMPFGGSEWCRNYLAVTGDCMMVRREVFEKVRGFNESFTLCGSDVELCLRVRENGYRVVYTPYVRLTHLEATMRGEVIPQQDFKLSYKYYEPFLREGDPYYNENISFWQPIPHLKRRGEKSPLEFTSRLLGTEFASVQTNTNDRFNEETSLSPSLWGRYSLDASVLSECFDFIVSDLEASRNIVLSHRGHLDIKSINWFVPDFDHAFYGGIHTILRFASYFKERKGVQSRFVVLGDVPKQKIATAIGQAFPNLSGERIFVIQSEENLRTLEDADASVATLWNTAYFVLKFNRTARKFYFIQDFEPLFYPAGSTNAQAEATYRFGFYGITNTMTLKEIYEREYGARAEFFTPAVNTQIFHPSSQTKMKNDKGIFTVFFYGRPGHPRNGFELGAAALRRLKSRLGKKVRILNAGAHWNPGDFELNGIVENLGLLQYEETAALYRTCDVGLVMMFTRHPSYLPFELMASGCLVVSNNNPATTWLLQDGVNCLLSDPSASCFADVMERALTDIESRARITAKALDMIQERYSNWEEQMEKVYAFACDPER